MTKILLLSDTHNFLNEKVFKYAEPCDQIWHAGDIGTVAVTDALKKIKPLVAVYGNIDGMDVRKEFPLHQRFMCEQVDVWITHIGGSPGRYSPEVKRILDTTNPVGQKPMSHGARLFICGHSHILKVMFDKKHNLLYMNPGAAGNYGLHKVKTLLRFSIAGKEIKDLEVIEIGKL
ncbi:MAG: metallophosphoesterase family protein [Bacteroidetes bacterium]|nr:metallophosphoesterase family protein [Bacteroidota bacterium]